MTQQAQDLELPELGTSKLVLSIFRQLKKQKLLHVSLQGHEKRTKSQGDQAEEQTCHQLRAVGSNLKGNSRAKLPPYG